MKKIFITFTIAIILFFLFLNYTLASEWYSEWYLEKLLDINYWVEDYDLNLGSIKDVNFSTTKFRKIFKEFKRVDILLKQEILKKYRNSNFSYYKVNDIISNYKNFTYYTNQFFYYISIKESNPGFKEAHIAILKNYRKMRIYYKRVKILVNKK